MPTYQYECDSCNYSFEAYQSITESKLKKCPKCGKNKLHRLIGTGGGIIFKGSGFYETDYKKKTTASSPSNPSSKETKKTAAAAKTGCATNCGCVKHG
ncbi:MAG: hypothetical protein A2Z88_00965 [Omnitrophica WOR_2 bacterium GWA2_47_8]|nr:MAG: hypothetical protein A2Z88_00965 [Omnitrophica WOR_2 bacterium GWA2_47_8]